MAEVSRRQMKAAVVRQAGQPLQIEDVTLEQPRRDEVLVRVVATGICHTDIVVRDQGYNSPLPAVFGHEGAGVVEAVGADVTKVAPGDHVVMSYAFCGKCRSCETGHPAHCVNVFPICFGGSRLDGSISIEDAEGKPLHDHFFGQSSFAQLSLANENNVIRVPSDLPLEMLAPLGCGLQTGSGAVLNALKVRPGSTFVAFGAGAVGLAAIMAGKIAGATKVIAVDVNPERLKLAEELGATHVINSRDGDPVAKIMEITGIGADFALECSGRPEVLRQAVDCLGFFGTCGIVGAQPIGSEVPIDVNGVMIPGKRIMGIVQGDVISDIFIPTLIEYYRQGRFPFDRLIKYYDFADINQAMEDSESGRTIKPVLRIGTV
ncbi:NAD(P)-dependent alcohol dehydrogenase [Sphingomonas sp. BIUV-7]|uniref:NAD(P)-dependent alcohol dehydrogenase n=1 Tax=Sphingomonas natans TaxID=3063330 RepID=A0ABT8YAC1_9SPHN|nr:NAD(P)-dependent alcohol dehydrogenase [Sphingomonas sp. BIUV-7]MDO6415282.1 NAD(P)-dependent alcohol dehydrogenase [Sphingomonas sp. BIUV-7]